MFIHYIRYSVMEARGGIVREISVPLPHSHLQLAGLEWNPQAKTTVLALHGWLDNAASFLPLSSFCPDVHLIAIDWPGHGHSQHIPAGMNYHFIDYVTYLHECITALGRESVILLGHSLGAAVASLFAGSFPEQVKRLLLIEGFGPIPSIDSQSQRRLREHVERRLSLKEKDKPLYTDVEKAVRARLMATPMEEASARLIVQRNLQETPAGLTWRTDQRLTLPSPQRFSEPQVANILGHITSPTMLITASEGLLREGGAFPVSKRFFAVKHLQHHTVAGNHHVHMDAPELVAPLIHSALS